MNKSSQLIHQDYIPEKNKKHPLSVSFTHGANLLPGIGLDTDIMYIYKLVVEHRRNAIKGDNG